MPVAATKICANCKVEKPRADYHPRRKGGTQIQANCKVCHRGKVKEYRDANWKQENAKSRARHARRMQDPDYRERLTQRWRDYYESRKHDPEYMEARRLASGMYRMKNGANVGVRSTGVEDRERLPIEPFREWLNDLFDKDPSVSCKGLALETGADEKVFRNAREGIRNTIELDVVDLLLTNRNQHLWELYPSLYE